MMRHAVLVLLGAVVAALMGACARLPGSASVSAPPPAVPSAHAAPPQRPSVIGVLVDGWHTGLILPARELGPLSAMLPPYADKGYVSFGWGNRRFYISPHPSLYDAIAALFRSPSVVLVQGASTVHALMTPGASRRWLCADRHEVWRVDAFLRKALRRVHGKPVRLGPGPSAGSAFYASTEHYDALHTCNTWTAQALHDAGLPVHADGVIFSVQLERRIAKLPTCPDVRYP